MQRFRLEIAYDGTEFSGWQNQKNARSVQEVVEKTLGRIFGERIPIVGAGRTDAGVHARGQAAHFISPSDRMKGHNVRMALNSFLPPDVRIVDCHPVSEDFHSRFSALARVYHYHLKEGENLMPWDERYVHRITKLPDLQLLNGLAATLLGERDFTTFSQAKDPKPSKCRYIYQSVFFPQGDRLIYKITGNAFLWKMVRSLVGSLIHYALLEWTPDRFLGLLMAKNRKLAGPTAPAKGLYFQRVIYDVNELPF